MFESEKKIKIFFKRDLSQFDCDIIFSFALILTVRSVNVNDLKRNISLKKINREPKNASYISLSNSVRCKIF